MERAGLVLTMFFLCNLGALTAARNPFDSDRYDWTVEEARQFDDFPLYWLGDEYDGLPLTRTYKLRSPAIPDTVGFVYGEEYPPQRSQLSHCANLDTHRPDLPSIKLRYGSSYNGD